MTTTTTQLTEQKTIPPLRHGERLTQPEFHRRYEAMPPGVRAELVGGIVYIMPSPVSLDHASEHAKAAKWLFQFDSACSPTKAVDNPTLIMSVPGEPQPDLCLLIREEYGGRSFRNERGYLAGSPELVVEIAVSSASNDLGPKKRDYEQGGVLEYVVVLQEDQRVVWFVLENGRYEELQPGEDGILRSRCFPGLWLDAAALLREDMAAVSAVVARGLASSEHHEWLARMSESHRSRSTSEAGSDTGV